MITIEVDDRKIRARLDSMPRRVHDSLVREVTMLRLQLENHIKGDKLSGQVLNVVSGNLRASIFSETDDQGDAVYGSAFSSGDVKYAHIHEYGGDIYPVNAKALAFQIDGKWVFSKHVHMPERSYLRSSLKDMSDQIKAGLRKAITEAVRE